jgi:hypothetical protein
VDGPDDPEDVRLELPPVVGEGQPLHGTDDPEAGIGDYHVDPAERVARRARHPLELAVPRDVARDDERSPPDALDLCRDDLEPVRPPGREDDVRALARELAGDSRADPGRSAGDEGHLSGETRPHRIQ